jgi:hypothetical protein
LINKNWPRWIFASLTKWFESQRDGISLLIEGDEQESGELKNYFEFRMTGPTIWEQSKNYFKIEVVVNILVVHKLGQGNLHLFQDLIGKAAAAFVTNIPVMKYGTGADDDRTVLFDCLIRDSGPVDITQLGQVNPEVKEMQAMVQSTYCMYHEE